MANKKISALTELTAVAYNDYLAIVDTTAGATKKISMNNLVYSYMVVAGIANLGTGRTDGELKVTADEYGNRYTWDNDNSKWRIHTGNCYATAGLPAAASYTIPDGTIVFDVTTGTTKQWNASAWSLPTSAGIIITGLTDLKVPKHVSDAVGLADTTITVSANNEVTNASQPAVLAYNSATRNNVTGNGTSYTCVFDTEVFDQNGDFASNVFTAPVTGIYRITISLMIQGLTATHSTEHSVGVIASNRSFLYQDVFPANANPFVATRVINYSALVDMDATDTVSITLAVNSTDSAKVVDLYGSASPYTFFSATLEC
uniref:C1q domain-containing protein n=1 Tax=viral metagenome TaxID=1070528 RepID=A0A6M3LK65_9ZZZZ